MAVKVVVAPKPRGRRSRTKNAPATWAASYNGPRDENQDYYGRADHETPGYDWQRRGCIYVLADGMGGLAAGAQAARMAVREVIEQYTRSSSEDPVAGNLNEAVRAANRKIYAAGQGKAGRMGSTIVACVLKDGKATIAHAGDSRAYLFQGGALKRCTEDHLYATEVLNATDDDEAKRGSEGHKITRALGKDPDIQVVVTPVDYGPDDRFLLCSDGFSEVLSAEEICECLSQATPHTVVNALTGEAGKRLTDNATAIVIFASGEKIRRRQSVKKGLVVLATILMATTLGVGVWWGWENYGAKLLAIVNPPPPATTSTITVSPLKVTFPEQGIGSVYPAQSVQVKNVSQSELIIKSQLDGDNAQEFQLTGCKSHLPAGADCTMKVTFTPTTAGDKSAELNITDSSGKALARLEVSAVAGEMKGGPEGAKTPTGNDDIAQNTKKLFVINSTQHSISFVGYPEVVDARQTLPLGVNSSMVPKHLSWYYCADQDKTPNNAAVQRGRVVVTDAGNKLWSKVSSVTKTTLKEVAVTNDTDSDVVVWADSNKSETVKPASVTRLSVIPAVGSKHTVHWYYSQDKNNTTHDMPVVDATVTISDPGNQFWSQVKKKLTTETGSITPPAINVVNHTKHPVKCQVNANSQEYVLQPEMSLTIVAPSNTHHIRWWFQEDVRRGFHEASIVDSTAVIVDDGERAWSEAKKTEPPVTNSSVIPPHDDQPAQNSGNRGSSSPPAATTNNKASRSSLPAQNAPNGRQKMEREVVIKNATGMTLDVQGALNEANKMRPVMKIVSGASYSAPYSQWKDPPQEICWRKHQEHWWSGGGTVPEGCILIPPNNEVAITYQESR